LVQRLDPFDNYRTEHKALRIRYIRSALAILSNATYPNITNLAIDVAKIVKEYEFRDFESLPEKTKVKGFKAVSHVTLLRNSDYRLCLHQSGKIEVAAEDIPVATASDFEALKIRNASLHGQIDQLKLTIRNIDSGILPNSPEETDKLRSEVEGLRDGLQMVCKILDNILGECSEVLITVTPGQETDQQPSPGLWGLFDILATYDELLKLDGFRRQLRKV
jgi:hypothetical protein